VIDELASPSTLDRAGLRKILDAMAVRSFDVLVIYEFGELSKNYEQSQIIINKMAEHSIKLAIVNDLTPEQMAARIARLPEGLRREVKSRAANLILRAWNHQN
jgi:DNA invertase Pin-like site-specific DNA recombinase